MIAAWLRLQSLVDGAAGLTPQQAYDVLGRRGIEGEALQSVRALVDGVVVAEVVAVREVPDRDLSDLDIVAGTRRARIVTGERSVTAGERVAWAPPGAMIGGRALAVRTMAGIDSEGMLVSAAELGLGGDGRRVMRVDATPGTPLAEALDDDWLMTFGVTPNRGDCLSLLGLARELAAGVGAQLAPPTVSELPEDFGALELSLADADCPFYLGVLIELAAPLAGRAAAPTTDLIERAGMRSIHPLVDLTNEVMLELGQPLHAFDADRIAGAVVVRAAQAGEVFEALDGVSRTLAGGELVIADRVGVLALAGVIGGARAEVGPQTRRILLESAHFRPARVMRGRRPHRLSTEASMRFERGVDAQGCVRAAARFLDLLAPLAGDGMRTVAVRRVGRAPGRRDVRWDVERAGRLLGAMPAGDEIERLLTDLGFAALDGDSSRRLVPSWRFDVEASVDLVEEVARAWGFERFAPTLPSAPLVAPRGPARAGLRSRLVDALVGRGFQQGIHLAFAPAVEGRVRLANPLGEQTGALRDDLLTGMLAALAHNHRHQETEVRLVETGVVFRPDGAAVDERWRIGLVWSGHADPRAWRDRRPVELWDLKGIVESLVGLVAPAAVLEAHSGDLRDSRWHPVRVADLRLDGRPLGFVAEVDPDWAAAHDLTGTIAVAELDVDAFVAASAQTAPQVQALPRFPASQRDLAFLLPRAVPAADLLRVVREAAQGPLVDAQVFDVYEGKGVPPGERSLAVRLTWRDASAPVAHETQEADVQAAVAAAAERLGARLRG
jgi:phenylalanyl-tRNA synthetase beta chain